jgi:hypothetical protein
MNEIATILKECTEHSERARKELNNPVIENNKYLKIMRDGNRLESKLAKTIAKHVIDLKILESKLAKTIAKHVIDLEIEVAKLRSEIEEMKKS